MDDRDPRRPGRPGGRRGGQASGVRRGRLRFRWDLIPILRSWRVVEQLGDDPIEWEREVADEEVVWRRRTLYTVGVLVAVVLLGAAVWLFLFEGKERFWGKRDVGVAGGGEASAKAASLDVEIEEVKGVVARFLGATTLEGKLACVVWSEGVEARMGDHYERHPARAQSVYDYPVIALRTPASGNYYLVQALTTDGGRHRFVVLPGPGGAKVAWESHVGYSEMDWGEFIASRPPGVREMRVYVEPSDHYRPPFVDRVEYLSVEFTRPGSAERLYGFVSRSGTEGVAGMRGALLSGRPEPVVVRLRFPSGQEGGGEPAVLVEAFVQRGWFVPASPR